MDGSPIAIVAKLLAILLGLELANELAPHLVILAGGFGGSILGVMDWRKGTRLETWQYLVGFTLLAWLLAGSVAWGIAEAWELKHSQFLLAPCAIGIAWIGHRWPKVGRWLGGLFRSLVERRVQ